jgi:hypothetical protein
MRCLGSGILQAYIDGELDIKVRKDVEGHLLSCEKCKYTLDELKGNDDFAFEKITYYKQYNEETDIQPGKHFNTLKQGNKMYESPKGVYNIMLKYKKVIAVACAVILVAACTTIQPVRAAISDALNIFRADNIQGIQINANELAQMRNNLSTGQGDLSLDGIGKIKMNGGQSKAASYEEVKKACDFPVLAAELPGSKPNIEIIEPWSIEFTLKAKNVNSILKSLRATKLLPETVDGKTFAASFAAQAVIHYNDNGKNYSLIQTKAPKIEVPEGVDVDELFNTLINLPIFPETLKSKLKSINDWKNTLYIPVIEPMQETIINGVKAYVGTVGSTEEAKSTGLRSGLVWMNNGAIYTVTSNTGRDDIMNFAENLK